MKRRDFIKVTGIGVAGAATMAAPAIAQSCFQCAGGRTPRLRRDWFRARLWPSLLAHLFSKD